MSHHNDNNMRNKLNGCTQKVSCTVCWSSWSELKKNGGFGSTRSHRTSVGTTASERVDQRHRSVIDKTNYREFPTC
jgi:hypothetical protein